MPPGWHPRAEGLPEGHAKADRKQGPSQPAALLLPPGAMAANFRGGQFGQVGCIVGDGL